MADNEQVKEALAALAERESRRDEWAGESERDRQQGAPAVDESSHPVGAEPIDDETDYRVVIERAVAATEDLDAAAEFVDTVGLDRLESAVEQAEHEVSGLAADGREALAAFERFRVAARGPVEE